MASTVMNKKKLGPQSVIEYGYLTILDDAKFLKRDIISLYVYVLYFFFLKPI